MTNVNPNNRNENLTSFFIGRKILKSFKDFCNWHFSISLQKRAQTSKVK